jgi:hypothetical protein
MVQSFIAVALVAQVITVLEPDYRLLLRADVLQKVKLSPEQMKRMMDATKDAERAYSNMQPGERRGLANSPLDAKTSLILPTLRTLKLDKQQKSVLVAETIGVYGPYLLHMPGMEGFLRITQRQKVEITKGFTAVESDYESKVTMQAKRSKVRYLPGQSTPLTPPFQTLKTSRDRSLWRTLMKHLSGPQILRVIVAMKRDPWVILKEN